MFDAAVLTSSVVLQLLAAMLALRLVRVTGSRSAWLLLAVAIGLMALRRSITLYHVGTSDGAYAPDLSAELVALLISVLMVLGIGMIGPVIRNLRMTSVIARERHDLESRVHAQTRELHKAKRRFQAFMDNSPAVAFVKDAEGRYVYVNEGLRRRFSFMISEWLGRTDWELWPEEFAAQYRAQDEKVLAGNESVEMEEVSPTAEGGTAHWLSFKFPFEDGRGDRFLGGMAVDITQRKQAEHALGEAERKLTTLLSNLPGMVYRCRNTLEWSMEFVSNGCLELTGYAPENLVTNNPKFGQLIDPDDRDMVWQNVQSALKARSQFELTYRIRTAAGEQRWVWERGAGVYDNDGQLLSIEGFIADITERKQTEQHLRETEQQLLHAQKMEAVGRLAGGVAHDFNNLLTVINGYAGMLAEEIAPDDPKAEMVRAVSDCGNRAVSLTRSLLAFSRKQILAPTVLDLNGLVRETDKMLRRLIGEDIELFTTLSPNLGTIEADAGQIEQVIMNLAVNARDAMPQGGKLTIETSETTLDDGYLKSHWNVKPGRYVMLAVSDTGCGMDSETQRRIFEPFFTTKEAGKGTGLGLATVFGIIKQSGGHIFVYSEAGGGTTFKIYLPCLEQADTAKESCIEHPEALQGEETVLLVEDEDGVRTLARRMMQGAGYTVLEARHGEEAIEIAREHEGEIDVAVSDVVMPRISGPQLVTRLLQLRPQMKVVYVSGYTDDAIVRHGIIASQIHFVQKPYTRASLLGEIRQALDAPESAQSPQGDQRVAQVDTHATADLI